MNIIAKQLKPTTLPYDLSKTEKPVNLPYTPGTSTGPVKLANAIGGAGNLPVDGGGNDYIAISNAVHAIRQAGSGAAAEYAKENLRKIAEAQGMTFDQAMQLSGMDISGAATINVAPKNPIIDAIATPDTPTTTDTTQETKNPIADAIATTDTTKDTIVTPAKATDNSGLINDQYGNLVTALKAQIQQSINNTNQKISGLDKQYQPIRNQSELQKANELRTALEISANNGDRGGIGRQQALNTQSSGDNRLNDINLQQENQKNELLNAIANLTLEGNVQEAQLQAAKLKDLISNNQYVDETNYNRGQDTIKNAMTEADLTGTYNGKDTISKQQIDTQNDQWQQVFDNTKTQQGIDNEHWDKTFDYNTAQDQINNDFRQGTFDYQKERDKVADKQWFDEYTSTLAWNSVNAFGYVNKQASQILGIPEGTKTLEAQSVAFGQKMSLQSQAMDEVIMTGAVSKENAKVLGISEGTKTIEQKKFEADQKTNAIDAAMQRTQLTGSVSKSDAKIIGVPAGTKTQQAKEFAEQQKLAWANYAEGKRSAKASEGLQGARLAEDRKQNAISNNQNQQQINLDKQKVTQSQEQDKVNNAISSIDSLYTYKDSADDQVKIKPGSEASIRGYIIGLNLADNLTDQLLLRYGLPIN